MLHWGIDLNPEVGSGEPNSPEDVRGIKWVRLVFKVNGANRDLPTAFQFYDRLVEKYNSAGIRVLFILHQDTYWGHGPWDHGDYDRYARDFAGRCSEIAEHYWSRDVAYEIWNESDAARGTPHSYGAISLDYHRHRSRESRSSLGTQLIEDALPGFARFLIDIPIPPLDKIGITPGISLTGLAASAGSSYWHDILDRLRSSKQQLESVARSLRQARDLGESQLL